MRMMLPAAAWLPDAFVRLAPPADDHVAEPRERAGRDAIELPATLDVVPGGVGHFTVGAELQLIRGGVADAYRRRPGMALEMIEHGLR